jgi:hypothetical protein
MGRTIILDLPKEIYEPLAKTAQEERQTPEELAVEWLAKGAQLAIEDPVEKLIGSLNSNLSGWADEHDKHIGQAIAQKIRTGRE